MEKERKSKSEAVAKCKAMNYDITKRMKAAEFGSSSHAEP